MIKRRRRAAWIFAPLAALGLAWACGGPQELAAQGEVCFRDDDCQAGLVCVAAEGQLEDRRCSSDVSGLISMVPGAPAPMGNGGEPAQGGAPPTTNGGAPGAGGTDVPSTGGTGGSGSGGTQGTSDAGTGGI